MYAYVPFDMEALVQTREWFFLKQCVNIARPACA